MSFQPFKLGNFNNIRTQPVQTFSAEGDQARFFDEVFRTKRREETCRAAGWQGVVRPGQIVTGSFRGVMTDEDRTGMSYPRQQFKGLINRKLKVLRSNFIAEGSRFIKITGKDNCAEVIDRLTGDGCT